MPKKGKLRKTSAIDPICRGLIKTASAGSKVRLFQKLSSLSESTSRAASTGHKSGGVKPIENLIKMRSQSGTFDEICFFTVESPFDVHMNL